MIADNFPNKAAFVEDLTRLLGFGKDAAYRRIRGDSFLAPEEMRILAEHYGISLDRLIFEQSNSVLFSFNAFTRQVKDFDDFFDSILESMGQMRAIPDVRIQYAALEIPIFYYSMYARITSFKLYVWGRSIWNMAYTQNLPFSYDLIPPSTLEKAEEIYHFYMHLPSMEMWSMNMFDNTLNQIEYHLTSGQFKHKEDALTLMDDMDLLCDHMRTMAREGHKRTRRSGADYAALEIYHNEMIYTNNTILVLSPHRRGVFTTYGNPNFLFSSDGRIVDYTADWFKRVLDKSTPLTHSNEKARNWYFDHIKAKIRETRERMMVIR